MVTDSRAALTYDQYNWQQPAAVEMKAPCLCAVAAAASAAVSIPMAAAIESLNAAIAMSVLFFEAARQRRR